MRSAGRWTGSGPPPEARIVGVNLGCYVATRLGSTANRRRVERATRASRAQPSQEVRSASARGSRSDAEPSTWRADR